MGCTGSKKKPAAAPSPSTGAAPVEQAAEPSGGGASGGNKKMLAFMSAIDYPIEQDYDIGPEIGRGGFSTVRKATNKKTKQDFAVKVIDKQAIVDDIKLLKREVDIMKRVEHKNILKLHEIYESDTTVYIVMELIDGDELFDRIVDRGYYSEKNAVVIIKQLLEAVKYLHDNGIAHRDLKPENLLCSGSGDTEVVKLADFGLSKIFDEEDLRTSCGTPGYVAPEVITSDGYTKQVDLWGIGIITYVLLAGYPPFYAEDDVQLFDKIIAVDFDYDDECWQEISEAAKDFISKLLVRDPSDRMTAEQAMKHGWLTADVSDKPLNIAGKMENYVKELKEDRGAVGDDTVAALNAARN
mmetsp:Transcript_25956/g.28860  ORF Transcript_25956/g.28860 Transcript_25956/m.28860 type:complete len:354 (-) Transcript_25956:1066-2127(-)